MTGDIKMLKEILVSSSFSISHSHWQVCGGKEEEGTWEKKPKKLQR